MTSQLNTENKYKEYADKLAEEYRREGFEVVVQPTAADLPFQLGRYQPDLLVRTGQGGFVIEIKSSVERVSVDQLSQVADEVKKHPGWRFLLVTAQDVASEGLPGEDDSTVSWNDVLDRIHHAGRLREGGDNEAAFLILWISLEQLLRIRAKDVAIPVERLSPSIMIRQLYSLGELSIAQFDAALECQRTRNSLVHGFPVGDLSSPINRLVVLTNELVTAWSGAHLSV
jgi:hypothetical protein